MSILQKAASTNNQVSGTWVDPTNAYGTTSNDTYATHTQSSRNGTAEIEYGFAGITTGEIPDGSTINSVKVVAEAAVNQSIGSIIQITIENPAGTAVGTADSTSATSDTVIQSTASTVPTLSDLRNGLVIASMFYDRANSPTEETVRIDYVYLEVDWTAGATTYYQSETAGLTFTGAFARLPKKNLTASLTPAGALTRSTSHLLTAALSFSALLGRKIPLALTAALSFSGALTRVKMFTIAFTASITPTASSGGGTIGDDTFTEAGTGTANLSTHTAETGGTWVKRWTEPGVTRDLLIDKDNDRVTLPSIVGTYGDFTLKDVAYSLGSTTLGDGYVEAELVPGAFGSNWLVARHDPANLDTFYFVKYTVLGLYLFRNTDYSYVQIAFLGSTTGNWVRFRVAGSSPTTLQVEQRTTQGALGTGWHIDTTDNTAANQMSSGYVGLVGEFDDDSGDNTGTADNFKVVSEAGAVAFTRMTGKSLTAALTPAGALTRATSVAFSAALTPAGELGKKVGQALAAALSFAGNLGTNYLPGGTQYQQPLTAALSFTAALTRSSKKDLLASLSPSATLGWTANRVLDASQGFLTFTGAMTPILNPEGTLYYQPLTAALSFTGALTRQTARSFAATLNPVASLTRLTTHSFTASLTPAGALVTSATIRLLLATGSTMTATMSRTVGLTLATSSTMTATMVRSVGITLAATTTLAANMTRTVGITLATTSTMTASLNEAAIFPILLAATTTVAASMVDTFIPAGPAPPDSDWYEALMLKRR